MKIGYSSRGVDVITTKVKYLIIVYWSKFLTQYYLPPQL